MGTPRCLEYTDDGANYADDDDHADDWDDFYYFDDKHYYADDWEDDWSDDQVIEVDDGGGGDDDKKEGASLAGARANISAVLFLFVVAAAVLFALGVRLGVKWGARQARSRPGPGEGTDHEGAEVVAGTWEAPMPVEAIAMEVLIAEANIQEGIEGGLSAEAGEMLKVKATNNPMTKQASL